MGNALNSMRTGFRTVIRSACCCFSKPSLETEYPLQNLEIQQGICKECLEDIAPANDTSSDDTVTSKVDSEITAGKISILMSSTDSETSPVKETGDWHDITLPSPVYKDCSTPINSEKEKKKSEKKERGTIIVINSSGESSGFESSRSSVWRKTKKIFTGKQKNSKSMKEELDETEVKSELETKITEQCGHLYCKKQDTENCLLTGQTQKVTEV